MITTYQKLLLGHASEHQQKMFLGNEKDAVALLKMGFITHDFVSFNGKLKNVFKINCYGEAIVKGLVELPAYCKFVKYQSVCKLLNVKYGVVRSWGQKIRAPSPEQALMLIERTQCLTWRGIYEPRALYAREQLNKGN